ncbi:MAG: hypothetical protein IKO72_05045 [Kiritimatiellae bacterium]|nr:hypothetical protein [Kiritimatiellia bacterium]
MKTKMILTAIVVGVLALSSQADETSKLVKTRLKSSAAVQLGVWHADLNKCKSYAEKNGVPLIAVWSNGESCGHCVMFEQACNQSSFKTWMKNSGCVFHFVYSGDKGNTSTYNFCYKSQALYPFIRVYWKKGGKQMLNVYKHGDQLDGSTGGSKGASKLVANLKSILKNYKYSPTPATPKYTGGEFGVSDEPGARLEAEAGVTTEVTLPLTRTNVTAQASVSTNTVMATYPDGTVVTNTVIWDAGESAQTLTYDTSSLKADEQITLTMLNAAGEELGTSHITAVAPVENSPKNPLWIGERDKDSLEWGEWTMDLDVATNKVNAFNATHSTPSQTAAGGRAFLNGGASKAYTLLLIGGSLWCPDCYAADEFLFDTDAFREWATNTHKVACVAIDEPRVGGSSPTYDRPTLLTRKSYETKNYGVVSGAGYLSRKMIADDEAAEVFARNLNFATNDTQHGGFCLPDNMSGTGNTGKWKTGIPCIILLRADGSVAGRLFQFSNSTAGITAADAPALVKRLDELLEQDADADEEKNDNRYTTEATISDRQTIAGKTLSFTDTADVYRFGQGMYGKRISLSLSGTSDASLILKVTKVSGKSEIVAAVATNKLSEGISVGIDVSMDEKISWFASISYPTDANAYPVEDQFALKSAASTLCAYTLKSDFVVIPAEVVDTNSVPDETGAMSVALVSNETYRISGLDPTAPENDEWLVQEDGSDIFKAIKTGDAPLLFMSESTRVQLWHPGKVGFVTPSGFTSESLSLFRIRLRRSGGVSGTASATVFYTNAVDSTKLDISTLIVEPATNFTQTFTWEEGDDSEKELEVVIFDNAFADGDQSVYFAADFAGDAAPGLDTFKLTLRDNDARKPGKLAITASEPSFSSPMTVFARAGEEMYVRLERLDGADGDIAGTLAATAGVLEETRFFWPSRHAYVQEAKLTLPSSGKKLTVTLTPDKGTAVDADRRKLTVNLLDPDVPGFETNSIFIAATRYVPIDEIRIPLDGKASDAATVKKHSGTLASGLSWRQEGKELVISGVPTKAGSTTAAFRVHNGAVAGLTVAVTVIVFDPTVSIIEGVEPVNTTVKTSRTFSDVSVFATNVNCLAGVLTLTIPPTGRLSAKYRTTAGTVSLACKSWSKIEEIGDDAPIGTLFAKLEGVSGTNTYALVVRALPDGVVEVDVEDPLFPGEVCCDIPQNVWSKGNPAADFKGYYTVSLSRDKSVPVVGDLLATGDAYVTLKMNTADAINSGKFTYAGVLPTGKSFSGSVVITSKDWNPAEGFKFWERALLPIVVSSSTDILSGALELKNVAHTTERRKVYRADENAIVWRHVENGTVVASAIELDAVGGLYVSTENFAQCCTAVLGKATLSFFACEGLNELREDFFDNGVDDDGVELSAGRMNTDGSSKIGTVNVVYTAANKKKKTAAKNAITSGTKALSLSFALSTGIVTGTFKLPFEEETKTMSFSGVVMPGWGDSGDDCGDCGAIKVDKSRPFISGTAWFNDEFENEVHKKVKVRRSCPFSVGVISGK